MVLENDTKHDRVCKSVTEIKGHAKNFPNAPRILLGSTSCKKLRNCSFTFIPTLARSALQILYINE